jgi:hypothetical protein
MKNFSFDKSFLKVFSEMNDKLDEMIDSVRKFKVTENEYSICNCSYKMRYITPQNISEYIDLLAKAMYKEMLDTPGDIERFSVECAKRFIKANQCDSFVSAVPLGYTPDPMTYKTLKDIIVGLNNDCFNKNCYSKYDMSQRSEHVKKDLKKITDMKFYVSMKNLVNGIPGVVDVAWNGEKRNHLPEMVVFREAIEAFILFAFAVNTITVSQMHDYLYTHQTVNIKHDDANNVVLTECAIMKTGETDLRLNLPFDINFRNIALSSVNNGFNELKNAIHYVLHDPASPVNQMVLKFATLKRDGDNSTGEDDCIIDRIVRIHRFDGHHISGIHTCEENNDIIKEEIMRGPNDGVSWLDTLAYGSQFIDASYRTDKQATGNVTQGPITSTLDMLFKIYNGCGCGLTSNEELANNIKHVEYAMNKTIRFVNDGYFDAPDLATDILALLGEILTRDIIMLVNNNTQVIDVSSFNTENNAVPAYLYNEFAFDEFEFDEEYVMEADNNQNNAPEPTQQAAKPEAPTVTVKTDDGKTKTITAVIAKFKAWIVKVVSKIYDKFNKDHKMEMDYFNKHQQLNAEIGKSIEDGSFRININKFPEYQIKWDTINPEHISQHVKDWLDVTKNKTFDETSFLAGLFPGKDDDKLSIAKDNNNKSRQEKIKNIILYSQIGTPTTYTGELSSDVWKNKILDPYEKSGTLIERYTKALAEQFNLATEAVEKQLQAGKSGDVKAEDVNSPAVLGAERAKQISGILTKYNTLFIVNPINVVMRDFYSTLYTTYASIIKAYKVMSKKKQNTNETNENPPEAANKEENK